MAGAERAKALMLKFGFNEKAFNWETNSDLVDQLEALVDEVHSQFTLDVKLAPLYASGTDAEKAALAAAEEWRAAGLALLRPAIFKLFGQHYKLDFEDADAFNAYIDRFLDRSQELIDDVLGGTPSTGQARGPVNDGFYDQCGERFVPAVTRVGRLW